MRKDVCYPLLFLGVLWLVGCGSPVRETKSTCGDDCHYSSIKSVPVMCTLSQDNRAERKKVLGELTRGIVERRELDNGMAYRFDPKPGVVSRLAQLIELERECCQFLTFRIHVEQQKGPVWLELRGPSGVKELIKEYFASQQPS